MHGEQKIANEVSGYYLAGHLGRTYDGMMIAVPEKKWGIFLRMSTETFNRILLQLAEKVNLAKFKKQAPQGYLWVDPANSEGRTPCGQRYEFPSDRGDNPWTTSLLTTGCPH